MYNIYIYLIYIYLIIYYIYISYIYTYIFQEPQAISPRYKKQAPTVLSPNQPTVFHRAPASAREDVWGISSDGSNKCA